MCNNKIVQYVPTKYDVKAVEGVCGQTGIHGDPVYCQPCLKQGAAKAFAERKHNERYNDY